MRIRSCSLWNGNGFGGWGNKGSGQIGADVALSNSIQHVSDQVNQGTISQLQSANTLQNTISQNTIAGMQSANALGDKVGGATFGLAQQIDRTGDQTVATINATTQNLADRLCAINNNITTQGFENRLQGQALAAQLASQHADLSRQIFEENCKDRELVREVQTQNLRDQLAQTQATNAALNAQINLTNQLTAQTAYLVNRLGTTSTATTA